MKTIYSLKEFKEEVKKIAKTAGEDHCSVKVEVKYDDSIEFTCYAHNCGLHTDNTMEGSLDKLRKAIGLSAQVNIDVEIDVEEPEQAN